MNCPSEVRSAVCSILQTALLRIRNANPRRASIEADHVHNLPRLLDVYDPALLDFYLTAERDSFVRKTSADELESFRADWASLERFLETSASSTRN